MTTKPRTHFRRGRASSCGISPDRVERRNVELVIDPTLVDCDNCKKTQHFKTALAAKN